MSASGYDGSDERSRQHPCVGRAVALQIRSIRARDQPFLLQSSNAIVAHLRVAGASEQMCVNYPIQKEKSRSNAADDMSMIGSPAFCLRCIAKTTHHNLPLHAHITGEHGWRH